MNIADAQKILAEAAQHKTIKAWAEQAGIPRTTLNWRVAEARRVLKRAEEPELAAPPDAPPGMEATRVATGAGICTLDELLAEADLDVKDWIVEWVLPNAWTNPIGSGMIGQFHQIKAMLRRRWPEAAKPAQPIRPLPREKPTTRRGNTERALLVPDSQNGYEWTQKRDGLIPYHDRRCWDLCLQIAQLLQPENIVFLGDMMDVAEWSTKFKRTPQQRFTTQPTIDELHWWLAQFRLACPTARIIYLSGNHEDRIDQKVVDVLPEAFELVERVTGNRHLSVSNLLALDALDIEYVPYDKGVWLWDTFIHHGRVTRKGGGSTVAAMLKDGRAECNEVVGHIHRAEVAYAVTLPKQDGVVWAMSPGTIARTDGAVPAVTERVDWHKACGVLERTDSVTYNDLVRFWHGTTRFRGVTLTGRDRAEEIAEATDWKAFTCSNIPQYGP